MTTIQSLWIERVSYDLMQDGWRYIGISNTFVATYTRWVHTNGNRMLVKFTDGFIEYIKNGITVKTQKI